MNPTDPRQTKLDWIRDAMKWIVGLATGLLALSVTYFFDRFAQAPRFAPGLWIAWGLLLVATVAGILAAVSTWKNIGGTGAFGPYLRSCYGIAMITFTAGFALLALVMMANVALARPPGHRSASLFLVAESLPPFEPASATPSDPRLVLAACTARQALADSGSRAALVVGRFDQRELSSRAQTRWATNLELAQRRAEAVAGLLTDSTVCRGAALRHVVTLTGGPRHRPPVGTPSAQIDAVLAGDRRVEVYGFLVRDP